MANRHQTTIRVNSDDWQALAMDVGANGRSEWIRTTMREYLNGLEPHHTPEPDQNDPDPPDDYVDDPPPSTPHASSSDDMGARVDAGAVGEPLPAPSLDDLEGDASHAPPPVREVSDGDAPGGAASGDDEHESAPGFFSRLIG
jgi:hypothetical protein